MSPKRKSTSQPPLRAVSLELGEEPQDAFPFSIPALRELGTLDLARPVPFLVGENGSGKSTFIEALAWAIQAVSVGSEPLDQDPTLEHIRPLGRALRPVWNSRSRRGFFLRAEDFFGFVKRTNRSRAELEDLLRIECGRYEMSWRRCYADRPKRLVIFDGGQLPSINGIIREVLDWLDRYLGPVEAPGAGNG